MGDSNSTKPQQEQPDDPFTCEICNEPVLSNNSLCVHPFRKLNECIRSLSEYLQFKNEEERVAEIKCPGSNCDKLLDPLTCPPALVPPEVSDRCYCPNRVCSALVVKECGGIVKKSMCPNYATSAEGRCINTSVAAKIKLTMKIHDSTMLLSAPNSFLEL
ncbi:hypothetical protein RHMOL_Rhmol11G0266500 [Rhododendron molle]|uniref:Uncharacterized protein n=1 Tax=Rhododendron molle TaxID=49168 RepID=A0ACC0LXF6_RHOML|nr:hypothetical protein RHMOL_Rhmol11G0266500 [Rhododendron molle]